MERLTARNNGAGCLLGLAAGDQGSGAAYGHHSQLAMLVAYELLRTGAIEEVSLRHAVGRLAGGRAGRSRIRGAPLWLDGYLMQEKTSGLGAGPHGGTDVATRCVAIGVWHRDDVPALVADSVRAAAATHTDRPSIEAAVALAGAVAALSHGQHGRDLVAGALEVAQMAGSRIDGDPLFVGDSGSIPAKLRRLVPLVGEPPSAIVARAEAERDSLGSVLAGIVIGAPLLSDPFDLISSAAVLRRRDVEVVVSALVGTQVGIVRWPSSIANDTWFAEVGRRLAERTRGIGDLPDLFEVEDRLSHGPPAGYR